MKKAGRLRSLLWALGVGAIVLAGWLIGLPGGERPVAAQNEPEPQPTTTAVPTTANGETWATGVVDGVPPGYTVVEGDIMIPIDQLDAFYGRAAADGLGDDSTEGYGLSTFYWTNGIVPYMWDGNVTTVSRTLMVAAMGEWEAVSGVDFQACPANSCSGNHIHIRHNTFNLSAIGMQGNGKQFVNIISWNNRMIMAHELGHALGMYHEQARPDRDAYVDVIENRVCSATDMNCSETCQNNLSVRESCLGQFAIQDGGFLYGPYDFASVMHYPRNSFSNLQVNIGGTMVWTDTLVPQPAYAGWIDTMGQRTALSERDKNWMGCIYRRSNWIWVAKISFGVGTIGECRLPYTDWFSAVGATPSGGTLWVEPGTYSATGTYFKPMTIKAPTGTARLGN